MEAVDDATLLAHYVGTPEERERDFALVKLVQERVSLGIALVHCDAEALGLPYPYTFEVVITLEKKGPYAGKLGVAILGEAPNIPYTQICSIAPEHFRNDAVPEQAAHTVRKMISVFERSLSGSGLQ